MAGLSLNGRSEGSRLSPAIPVNARDSKKKQIECVHFLLHHPMKSSLTRLFPLACPYPNLPLFSRQGKHIFMYTPGRLLAFTLVTLLAGLGARAPVARAQNISPNIIQPYFQCFRSYSWNVRRKGDRMGTNSYYKTAADENQTDNWISANSPADGPFLFQVSGCRPRSPEKRDVLIKSRGTWAGAHIEIVDCEKRYSRKMNSAQWKPAAPELLGVVCD
jgi:hypothetical protein